MELIDRLRAESDGLTATVVCVRADLLGQAADEIERLNREGVPGVMHQVDHAFYRLTVLQRDLAWSEVEAMRTLIQLQRERIEALEHPEPARVTVPVPECPQCGERKRIEVHMIDVGTESGISDQIPGSFSCLNPVCPSNIKRYVHAHPTIASGDTYPCCGTRQGSVDGLLSTTDPIAVTCPGRQTNNPEEGPTHG